MKEVDDAAVEAGGEISLEHIDEMIHGKSEGSPRISLNLNDQDWQQIVEAAERKSLRIDEFLIRSALAYSALDLSPAEAQSIDTWAIRVSRYGDNVLEGVLEGIYVYAPGHDFAIAFWGPGLDGADDDSCFALCILFMESLGQRWVNIGDTPIPCKSKFVLSTKAPYRINSCKESDGKVGRYEIYAKNQRDPFIWFYTEHSMDTDSVNNITPKQAKAYAEGFVKLLNAHALRPRKQHGFSNPFQRMRP